MSDAGPTDAELADAVRALVMSSDLSELTTRVVMERLGERFSADLSERKQLVKDAIAAAIESIEGAVKQEEDVGMKEELDAAEDQEDASAGRRPRRAAAAAPKKKAPVAKAADGSPARKSGWNAPVEMSPALRAFLGPGAFGRPQIVAKLWEYFRAHSLQNPANKREILFDEALQGVFRVKKTTMFKINKLLTAHVYGRASTMQDGEAGEDGDGEGEGEEEGEAGEDGEGEEEEEQEEEKSKTPKKRKARSGEEDGEDGAGAAKRGKKATAASEKGNDGAARKNNAWTRPWALSLPLARVVGAKALARGAVVKQLWVYIKANNLNQGPKITCDERLKAVMGVDSVNSFGMMKLLSKHIIPLERQTEIDYGDFVETYVPEP